MTHFVKPKRPEAPSPQICARCRTRLGEVYIRHVGGPSRAAGDSKRVAELWLCSACAEKLRPDEPGHS